MCRGPTRDKLPLFSASALDHQYVFGFCLFRQVRDATLPRGFFQVPRVLHRLLQVVQRPHSTIAGCMTCTFLWPRRKASSS